MVYCTRCGTQNPDTAANCSNCGAPLISDQSRPYTRHEHRRYYQSTDRRRGRSGVGLLIAGLFIIVIGVAALTGFTAFWTYFWPLLIILIGVWILVLGLRHSRRYRQPPPA